MILQTGMRTDIPAFYSRWFLKRLREGFVLVRNPYDPQSVTRYRLDPSVVDLMGFCSKNPAPMLPHLDALRDYGQYWFVTITPYGRDIEPHVPDKEQVMEDFKRLSDAVGPDSMGWRYDPILINEQYPVERHIRDFEHMAKALSGYTESCVISFLDLYEKVKRNFPEARELRREERITLGQSLCPDRAELWHDHPRLRRGDGACPLRGQLRGLHDGGDLRKGPGHASFGTEEEKPAGRPVRLPAGHGYRRLRQLRPSLPLLLCQQLCGAGTPQSPLPRPGLSLPAGRSPAGGSDP